MYILVAGGGKVGANLARELIEMGHELTVIEQRQDRFDKLEAELESIKRSSSWRIGRGIVRTLRPPRQLARRGRPSA